MITNHILTIAQHILTNHKEYAIIDALIINNGIPMAQYHAKVCKTRKYIPSADILYYEYRGGIENTGAAIKGKPVIKQAIAQEPDSKHATYLDKAIIHLGEANLDHHVIIQDNIGIRNTILIASEGYNVAQGNTIVQGNRGNVGKKGNYAWFRNAHGNKLTQGDSGDSVYVQSNVAGNTIRQGKGADYLDITPSITSKDNVFDGGTSSWGLIFKDKDAVRFRGKREDYTFTFHANGEFTVIHKPTGANPGIFRNYEEVYFDDSTDAIPLKQIEEEARGEFKTRPLGSS